MMDVSGVTLIAGGEYAVLIRNSDGSIYSPSAKKDFSVPAYKDDNNILPWAKWGEDNNLPTVEFARMLENTGVLASGVDMIARIAMGRGPVAVQVTDTDEKGNEIVTVIKDEEISEWLEMNNITNFTYETILDICNTGHCWSQLMANKGRDRINRILRTDAAICRFGKRDEKGRIHKMFMSYEWDKAAQNDKYLTELPMLDRSNPYQSLLDEDGKMKPLPAEFSVSSHYPLFNRQYYALPKYWPARAWCDIAIGVPAMKAAMFNNQMTIKYVIEIDEAYWSNRWQKWSTFTDAQKQENRKLVLKELDEFLSGNKNAYKSLITGTKLDPVSGKSIPYITVTPIDDKVKDGKLLPDSAAANSEILFTLMLNPALIGVDMPGGMYGGGKGGSNIREAFMVQILMREIERQYVAKPLNLIAKVNGWKKKHPGLQWRFPNHYLTTLDSGKNAEPII